MVLHTTEVLEDVMEICGKHAAYLNSIFDYLGY